MYTQKKNGKALFRKAVSFLIVLCMLMSAVLPLMAVTAFAAAPTSYTTIETDSTAFVSITTSGDAKYFQFVPTRSGTYYFYSTNYSGDPYGALLDANGAVLISSDDNSSRNFGFNYYCSSYTTYYVKAYMFSSYTGSYTLNIQTVSVDCDCIYTLQSTTTADCENDGVETYVCSRCGDTYTNTVTSAFGHNFENGTCTRCGEVDYSTVTNVSVAAPYQAYPLFNSGRTGSASYYNSSYNYDESSFTNGGYDLYAAYSRRKNIELGLRFTMAANATEKAQVTIYAYDVDEESGERDCIRLVDETTGVKTVLTNTSGKDYLSGRDSGWSTTTFEIPADLLIVGHTYHLENEETVSGWVVYIRTVDLQINGLDVVPPPPEYDDISFANLSGYISSSGTVYTNLDVASYSERVYDLEYKATYLADGAQRGAATDTVTIPTEVTTFANAFNLESGSKRGTYEISVFIKLNGQVKITKTFSASYGYSAVSYNENGGSNNKPTDTNTYSDGDTVTVRFDDVPSMYGYNFLGWSTDRYATEPMYTEDGTNTFTIGASDVTLYAVWALAVCEHIYELQGEIPATCCQEGEETYVCSLCGDTYTNVLPQLDHHFVEGSVVLEPTCTEEGLKNPDWCDLPNCELQYITALIPIPALGHDYVNGVCSRCGVEAPSVDVWDGSADTSWYHSTDTEFTIYTAEQLAGLAQLVNDGNTFSGKTIYLGNNIDLDNREWTPIGKGVHTGDTLPIAPYFSGVFDGMFHTVNGMVVTQNATTDNGLFGIIYNATVRNLGNENVMINVTLSGLRNNCGGIVGTAYVSQIANCYATGSVTSHSGHISTAAGIVGVADDGSRIENCWANVVAESGSGAGGLVGGFYGYNLIETISNSFAIGTLTCVGGNNGISGNGGVVAYVDSGTIENCFFAGTLVGHTANGIAEERATILNSYHNSNASDRTHYTSLSNLQSQSWIESNLGWDFDTVWTFNADSDYPVLRGFYAPIPHVHEFEETTRTDAGCTTYGEIVYTCGCGETRRELIEPTQHHYQVAETVEATCTEDGYIHFACQNAGCVATKRQTIERLGHIYGDDNVCDRCGHVIEIHEHNYTVETVAPTCTAMGYTQYTCSCGHSYRNDYVEPTRHAWDNGVVTTAATCTSDGVMTYTCQICAATKTTVIVAGHQWSEVVTVEKTCTTDGSKTKTCTACGAVEAEVIPAGHNWDNGIEALAATCVTEGAKICTCMDCGETQEMVIPALGHSYTNGICTRCGEKFIDHVTPSTHPLYGMYFEIDDILSDYGPSLIDEYGLLLDHNSDAVFEKVGVYLTQDGTMWRRCIAATGTNIQYATYVPYLSYQSDIKYTGLNHDWINIFRLSENDRGVWCYNDFATIGVNLEDAYGNLLLSLYDIGQAGAETRIFDNLDEMKAWLYGECFEHDPSDWIVDNAPSCAPGHQHKECTVCGTVLEREEIPPVENHTPSEWIVDVEPTATQTGLKHKECTVCTTVLETEVMPILARLVIENVEAEAGKTVRVTIDIQNNPGIIGALLTIEYDPALRLVGAEVGSAWNTLNFTAPPTFSNPCNFVWDGINGADYSNGSIIVLTFELPADAPVDAVYSIRASYTHGNMINANLEMVDLEIENGSIKVIKPVGDVNDDGVVDVADVITLRRYLAGGYGVTIDFAAADMDDNGSITVADVVLLRRFLVG